MEAVISLHVWTDQKVTADITVGTLILRVCFFNSPGCVSLILRGVLLSFSGVCFFNSPGCTFLTLRCVLFNSPPPPACVSLIFIGVFFEFSGVFFFNSPGCVSLILRCVFL